jgi:hypothetical protein
MAMTEHMKRLAEIEAAAETIVDAAQEKKKEVEHEIQEKRDKFDAELEQKTNAKLAEIQEAHAKKMDAYLEEQRQNNQATIDDLKKRFEENHTEYAKEILKKITSTV